MRERIRSDRGASIFMLAISLFLLIGASAIAVDIAAIWLDRSTDQKVTDAAAAVGILEAFQTGSQAACEAALNYVEVNTPDLDSVDSSDCATYFSGACVEGDYREREFFAGRYEIKIVYPVEDLHDLMTSRTVSRTPQALIDDDGKECERLGVQMTSTRNSLFAQVLGFGSGTTSVSTVAKRFEGDEKPPLNLIVLDRTGCKTISVNGGGQIIATPVVEYDAAGTPIGLVPGLIIADSDGSGCSGANGVINVSGAGSVIRSDGAAHCGWGNGHIYRFEGFDAEQGCGRIQVLAPGTPGCNLPACSVSGGANEPEPPPAPLGNRYTRQVADHRYNCYRDYENPPPLTTWAADPLNVGNQQIIQACDGWDATGDGTDYIYNLIEFVRQAPHVPTDFELWSADPTRTCNPSTDITVNANVIIDCNTLQITSGKSVTINGNAVFNRSVSVNGKLTIKPPADEPWIFFRGGRLSKAASATISFIDAMVYMAKGSEVQLSGGAGPLTWTAPPAGVGYENFENLALWSDSTVTQSWSGQADLTLRGVFFMPRATASYSGSGVQDQADAQWLAWRLDVGGGAILKIAPSDGDLPFFGDRAELIR